MSKAAQTVDARTFDQIAQFVEDMNARTAKLPRAPNGAPVDDTGEGEYREFDPHSGITLELDWAYLDCKHTSIHVDAEQFKGYDEPSGPQLLSMQGPPFCTVVANLADATNGRLNRFEWDEGNGVWHG